MVRRLPYLLILSGVLLLAVLARPQLLALAGRRDTAASSPVFQAATPTRDPELPWPTPTPGPSPTPTIVVTPTEPPVPPQPTPFNPPPENLSIPNEVCLGCHGQPNISMQLENGEVIGLFVPQEVYGKSVHGHQGVACVQCHANVGNYPHPPFQAADLRDLNLKLYPLCQRCHAEQFTAAQDSVHATALASGNRNAAVCTDCHTSHAVQSLTDPQTGKLTAYGRQWVPNTCARCHYSIYQEYSTSVHGAALLDAFNPDVPTCIDCHGVHNIPNPTTAAFRLRSPQICANCHTDPAVMDKYGISTQVLSTYVADFHGTTVTIFAKENPDQETNKPVCYDCHGVHDIKDVSDPVAGLNLKENLLARCRVCHPDANANFPSAWLSHYIPSPTRHPMVYAVNLFYSIFIPGVLGGMAVLVILDVSALARRRFRRGKPESVPGAAIPGASVPGPAVPGASVSGPSVSGPAAPDEAALGPVATGPTGVYEAPEGGMQPPSQAAPETGEPPAAPPEDLETSEPEAGPEPPSKPLDQAAAPPAAPDNWPETAEQDEGPGAPEPGTAEPGEAESDGDTEEDQHG